MALEKYTLVSYKGTDIGKVYIEDIGKRKQLGGGDQFVKGQDIVIEHGDTIALVNSGNVLVSSELGIIKTWSTWDSTQLQEIIAKGGGTAVWGVTGSGVTGLVAPFKLIPSAGVTGVFRKGTTGTKANPPHTIGEF